LVFFFWWWFWGSELVPLKVLCLPMTSAYISLTMLSCRRNWVHYLPLFYRWKNKAQRRSKKGGCRA
jgi:hypothetical protein